MTARVPDAVRAAHSGRARRRTRPDGTTLLTVYIVLLFALPSRLILAPLGAAGTPANVLAIGGVAWWLWSFVGDPDPAAPRAHPTRRAMLVVVAAMLVSYIAAMTRAISPEELSTANTGMLLLLGWLGLVLTAEGFIPNHERLEVLLGRLSMATGLVALLGLVQFATGRPWVDLIEVPGLVANVDVIGVYSREGYTRPSGTAIHPIEFGVSLAALLPICLHVAFHHTHRSLLARWFPVMAIMFAIPLSISRSAIVGALVGLAFVFPTWSRRTRAWGLIMGSLGMAAIFVVVPGMLGTLIKLFTRIQQDDSAASRTDSYPLAADFIARSPWVGRGFQTFLPQYRILDNQYLLLLIDIGIIGTLALLVLFVTAILTGLVSRRRHSDPVIRSASISLAAAVASGAACLAFVDGLSFPMMTGTVFLCVGLVGTAWALPDTPSPTKDVVARETLSGNASKPSEQKTY